MLETLNLLAQSQPAGQSTTFIQSVMPYVPLILVVVVMYYFVINAKRKEEKTRKNMMESMKKGDRVQTIGGILATIVQVDGDEVLLKVDETSNTKVRFTRTAIHKVLTDSKAETK